LLVLAGVTAALAVSGVPASAATSAPASCVPAADATYRHGFDGAGGWVTITAVRPLCSGQTQAFTLVSYTAGGFAAAGQFVYDTDHATISSHRRTVTLDVAVPGCYAQVDAIIGTGVRTETSSSAAPYGSATLGSPSGPGSRSAGPLGWHAGGTATCTAVPTVTFDNACDGTLTATVANGSAANVQAVFLTSSRRIRLPAGRSTTLKAAAGSTLTIRDNTFTTYVGTWHPPATACPAATPAETALPAPAATQAVAVTLAAKPSVTPSPTSTFTPEPAASAYSVNPDMLATPQPTALARTGMSTASLFVICAGLLLIGAGLAALVYLIRNARQA
jgi:hypothetical protein